ncbi:MAG: gliding motility-associated C-terminal domain-containing protein [Fluviicola sp.]
MSDKDQIKDLFSEKLGNFEAKVNPELWANVASQVGAVSGAAGTGGMSLLTKAIIGISGAAVITTGVVVYVNSDAKSPEPKKTKVVVAEPKTPSKDQKTDPLIDDAKTFIVENNSIENPIEPALNPDRNVAPTTGPGDGGDTLLSGNVPPPPAPNKPEVNELNTGTSTPIQEIIEQAGKEDIDEARNKDIRNLQKEHLTIEDEPTNGITPQDPQDKEEVEEILVSLEIPNTFTPGSDASNDFYHLNGIDGVQFNSFEFVVYDRTGKPVMITQDPNFRWLGIDPITGQLIEKGTYFCSLVAETEKGTPIKKTGKITVY